MRLENNVSQHFYQVLFTTLLANMPKDTRNMMTNTKLMGIVDTATHWKIVITGPSIVEGKNYDYAYEVNYNKRRGRKEVKNYMYVERNIKQVANVFGMVVNINGL